MKRVYSNMKNKITVPAILLYFLGLTLIAVGISGMIKTDLGITVVSSFPYSLNIITGILTVGMWITIIQCVILIAAIIILRRITISMLASFITAYLLGLFIDLFNLLFASFFLKTLVLKIGLVILSSTVMATGAAILVFSGLPPIPDLVFLRDVAKKKNIDMGRLKQYFDLIFLILTVTLTLIALKRIIGVGSGTIISFLIVGFVIGFVSKILNKYAFSKHFIDEARMHKFFEFNILSLFSRNQNKTVIDEESNNE